MTAISSAASTEDLQSLPHGDGLPLFRDIAKNFRFNAVGVNGYRLSYLWDEQIDNWALGMVGITQNMDKNI